MQKTAAVIKPPREFRTQEGTTLVAHDVVFDDGEEGTIISAPSGSEAMQAALATVKGQPVDWDLDQPREWQGVRKWKIRNFPGKPTSSGGARRSTAWVDQTPSMEAQGAVKQAVTAVGMYHPERETLEEYLARVQRVAEGFYRIVQAIKAAAPQPAAQPKEQPEPDPEDDGQG